MEKPFFDLELYGDEGKIIITSTGKVDNIKETLILEVNSNAKW